MFIFEDMNMHFKVTTVLDFERAQRFWSKRYNAKILKRTLNVVFTFAKYFLSLEKVWGYI